VLCFHLYPNVSVSQVAQLGNENKVIVKVWVFRKDGEGKLLLLRGQPRARGGGRRRPREPADTTPQLVPMPGSYNSGCNKNKFGPLESVLIGE
jgi:hypothetical protein